MSGMDHIDEAQQKQLDKNDHRDAYQWAAIIALLVGLLYLNFVGIAIRNGAGQKEHPQRIILEVAPQDLKEACAGYR